MRYEGPRLPVARGPLSAGVRQYLLGTGPLPPALTAAEAPAYGDDLQLALYVCYRDSFAVHRASARW